MRGVGFFLFGFVLAAAVCMPVIVKLVKQADNAHTAVPGCHLPVTIPGTRATSATPDVAIPQDAVFFCARDLSECIARNITNVQKITPSCDADGKCSVSVEFYTGAGWLEISVIISLLCSLALVLSPAVPFLTIVIGPFGNIDSRLGSNPTLRRVFCEAIGLHTLNNPCGWAAYSDSASLVVYTFVDGLCICRPQSYPVLPAFRLHKVEKPTCPTRVSMPWHEAICQTNTGVRMDVCSGLGIEWRADGGLRVWATVHGRDVAYDSVAIEAPASANE